MLADAYRTDRTFQVGDWVWLKLQPYRQSSIKQRFNEKISPNTLDHFKLKPRLDKLLTPSTSLQQPKYTILSMFHSLNHFMAPCLLNLIFLLACKAP